MITAREQRGPRSFGGGPLAGERLVRLAYLDEAGISANEKTAVVAGVIVAPDTDYAPLETRFAKLVEQHVPPERRAGFAFHAKELMWGGKKNSVFPRDNSNPEKYWPILEEILVMARQLEVPIIVGALPKDPEAAELLGEAEYSVFAHSLAYMTAVVGVNHFMQDHAKSEWTMLIAEERPEAKAALRDAHALMRDPERLKQYAPQQVNHGNLASHVREGVLFAAKHESIPLQLADAVACVIRREIDGAQRNERFIRALIGSDLDSASLEHLRQKPSAYKIFISPTLYAALEEPRSSPSQTPPA